MKPSDDGTKSIPEEGSPSAVFPHFSPPWFEGLFKSRLFAIFVHDRSGQIIEANPAFFDILGYSRPELPELSLERLLETEQLVEYRRFVEECRKPSTASRFIEMAFRTRDGGKVWLETDCSAVYENGTSGQAIVAARDITSRKSIASRLRSIEENYHVLFHHSANLIALVDLDLHLIDVNRKFEDELGIRRQDLIGQNVTVHKGWTAESADRLRLHLKEVIEGKPQASFEVHARRQDGALAPFEVRAVGIMVRGTISALQISLRSIRGRKDQEEALRNSEETIRVLMNAVGTAAFLVDTDGTILSANQEAFQMMEMAIEDMSGKLLTSFFPPEVAELWRQKQLEVIHTRKALHFDDEFNGRRFFSSIHPIYGEKGQVIQLAVFIKDVTEKKKSEEERKKLTAQLQQAQKMEAIGTLAGGIAHDFNNLLMAIQGNVSLILFDMDASHPHHRVLANIEKLIRSGSDLTSKLLGYARKGKYEAKLIGLNELVRETSETFGRMRKDITIYRDLAENLKSIIADKGQIEQVLLNLFVNAADAMPNGGKIILTTRNVTHQNIRFKGYAIKPGKYVELTVTDTGVGMEPEILARIFDPFFTTKKIGRGTGLGLASAYGIIKSHNGFIDVESEKGKGSIFYIYLPSSEERLAAAFYRGGKPEAGIGTILLVDDEETVLEVTAQMIERLGYTVIMARSGREAIRRFQENPQAVSLVILDMIMPEMGGGEVFDQLKRIDPQVKVLLASGFSMQGQAREIMDRGCVGFIQKPFTLEDLSLRLRSILSPP